MIAAWSEPHRRYHGLAHLAAVLGLVAQLEAAATDPAAVRLAAWYHDAVYDPTRQDNEAGQCAAGAGGAARAGSRRADRRRWSGWCCSPPATIRARATRTVRCSATPTSPCWPGRPRPTRPMPRRSASEYGHLSDEVFTAGRIAVLEQLLALPELYRLPAVAAEWTPRARANLTAELALLRSRAASAAADPPPSAG